MLFILDDYIGRLQIQHHLDGFIPHFNVVTGDKYILDMGLFVELHPNPFLYLLLDLLLVTFPVGEGNFFRKNRANFLKSDNFNILNFLVQVVVRVSDKQNQVFIFVKLLSCVES